jgi:hypothetical protein
MHTITCENNNKIVKIGDTFGSGESKADAEAVEDVADSVEGHGSLERAVDLVRTGCYVVTRTTSGPQERFKGKGVRKI